MSSETIRFAISPKIHNIVADFSDYKETSPQQLGEVYLEDQAEAVAQLNLQNIVAYQEIAKQKFGISTNIVSRKRMLEIGILTETKSIYIEQAERMGLSVPFLGKTAFMKGLTLDMISEKYNPDV